MRPTLLTLKMKKLIPLALAASLAACTPDDTGQIFDTVNPDTGDSDTLKETGDTSDTSETGDTGEILLPPESCTLTLTRDEEKRRIAWTVEMSPAESKCPDSVNFTKTRYQDKTSQPAKKHGECSGLLPLNSHRIDDHTLQERELAETGELKFAVSALASWEDSDVTCEDADNFDYFPLPEQLQDLMYVTTKMQATPAFQEPTMQASFDDQLAIRISGSNENDDGETIHYIIIQDPYTGDVLDYFTLTVDQISEVADQNIQWTTPTSAYVRDGKMLVGVESMLNFYHSQFFLYDIESGEIVSTYGTPDYEASGFEDWWFNHRFTSSEEGIYHMLAWYPNDDGSQFTYGTNFVTVEMDENAQIQSINEWFSPEDALQEQAYYYCNSFTKSQHTPDSEVQIVGTCPIDFMRTTSEYPDKEIVIVGDPESPRVAFVNAGSEETIFDPEGAHADIKIIPLTNHADREDPVLNFIHDAHYGEWTNAEGEETNLLAAYSLVYNNTTHRNTTTYFFEVDEEAGTAEIICSRESEIDTNSNGSLYPSTNFEVFGSFVGFSPGDIEWIKPEAEEGSTDCKLIGAQRSRDGWEDTDRNIPWQKWYERSFIQSFGYGGGLTHNFEENDPYFAELEVAEPSNVHNFALTLPQENLKQPHAKSHSINSGYNIPTDWYSRVLLVQQQ